MMEKQCSRCGSKHPQCYQEQSRLMDEPMKLFLYCSCCGKKWEEKQNKYEPINILCDSERKIKREPPCDCYGCKYCL